MKRLAFSILVASMLAFSGCMNLYTRCPFTENKIERTYQQTEDVFSLAAIVSFPQIMSDNPSTPDFMLENIFTVPCGIVVGVDGCLEFVLDTVFWPFDKAISNSRSKK